MMEAAAIQQEIEEKVRKSPFTKKKKKKRAHFPEPIIDIDSTNPEMPHSSNSNPDPTAPPPRPPLPKPTPLQIQKAKERRLQMIQQARKEKRIMFVSCVVSILGIFFWLVAIATDSCYVTIKNEEANTDTLQELGVGDEGIYSIRTTSLIRRYVGILRMCEVNKFLITEQETCSYHNLFPNRDEMKRLGLDDHVIDYRRTQITFALLSILLMVLSLLSAFYTFKNGRYMYKRLAAFLLIISAGCNLIVLEAVITCLQHELLILPFLKEKDTETSYRYSFYLGWTVFLIYLISGAIFLVFSRKKKRSKWHGSPE